jgi:hypothetical protein
MGDPIFSSPASPLQKRFLLPGGSLVKQQKKTVAKPFIKFCNSLESFFRQNLLQQRLFFSGKYYFILPV